jgi:hypothetical protein
MLSRVIFMGALFAVSLSASACAVAGSSAEYPSATIRYKMTVEVETPEGIKTGSAVREISMVSRPMRMGDRNDTHVRLEKGEAVRIDLKDRGDMFALLDGPSSGADYSIWLIFRAFPSPCPEGPVSRCGIKYYSNIKPHEMKVLDLKNYPTLVRFKNIMDPLSVEVISKHAELSMPDGYGGEARSLEGAFGAGVSINSIKVEMTKDASEQELRGILPWLGNIKGPYLHGGISTFGAPYGLGVINFIKE